ncbi:response regulator transcription factor [Microbacterium sp. LMI1-1-1.1]|uniref:response regulator transcription factor n=1 Tax=unclassified Microbacterium TaxID=2609290 RepID=UPI003466AC4E
MTQSNVAVVVEDDVDIRGLISAVLEQIGLEVRTAPDGLRGVELVRESDPVLTTLDVSMPGIDGFEATRRIRGFSATRIMIISARATPVEQGQGLACGADAYLTKPFRPRELRERVQELIGATAG